MSDKLRKPHNLDTSMQSLYEIVEEREALLALTLEIAEGNAVDVAESVFLWAEEIFSNLEHKIEAYCKIIRDSEARSKAKREEAASLLSKAKSDEAFSANLKTRMMDSLLMMDRKSIRTPLFNVIVRKNGGIAPLMIKDSLSPSDLDERFTKTSVELDKQAIRAILDEGEILDFAYIGERGTSLVIK